MADQREMIDGEDDERDLFTAAEDEAPEQEEAPEAAEAPEDDEEAEIERRARAQGWLPESEWDSARAEREGRRKPKVFYSAREYLERAENSMPILRDQLHKLTTKATNLEKMLENTNKYIEEQRQATRSAVKRAFEQGRAQAEQEMREAVELGDLQAFDKARAKLENIEKQARTAEAPPAPPPQREEAPPIDPEIEAWVKANPWFQQNPVLNRAMIDEEDILLRSSPGLSTSERLRRAKERVQQRYSDQFPAPRRPAASSVSAPSGTTRAVTRNASSVEARFNALPADVRQAYDRHAALFKERGATYTKEEFLSDYEI